jgi:hypothetical protein
MAEASGSGAHQFNNIFLSMRSGLVSNCPHLLVEGSSVIENFMVIGEEEKE